MSKVTLIDGEELFTAYRAFCSEAAFYPDANKGTMKELTYLALGLAGESGESVDVIKKALRDNVETLSEERRTMLIDELGDLFWYQARLLDFLGISLKEVLDRNVDKLTERYPDTSIHKT